VTDVLIAVALVLVAVTATAAVLNQEPLRQALVLSFLGLTLALLFAFVQAPDVSLSQLAVGSALTPLMIVLTVRKVRRGTGGATAPGTTRTQKGTQEGTDEDRPRADRNTGDRNTGDRKTGDRKTGDGRTGDRNSRDGEERR
jgi:energy-converting hydrogenase B subunit D